jgi:valyl-tRNA synthetase
VAPDLPETKADIPAKPSLDGLESKWSARWEAQGTYRFDRSAGRDQVYAIDTPPPTVSGSLHVGHAFSYTHTDTMARFKRMRGFHVFYPMGWDDNGLPTERRVQNYFNVRCDPSLPYTPGFTPPATGDAKKGDHPVGVSRPNFVELCERLTASDEQVFEATWRYLGLSVDWTQTYTTAGGRARRASQRAFLRLLARDQAYTAEAPTLWDIDFRTAVAQAELVDKEVAGAYHRLVFHAGSGSGGGGGVGGASGVGSQSAAGELLIDTTRPELLPACVAVVAHPDDGRYQAMFDTVVTTPIFGVEVPVVAHPLADPDKGTGIAMICTFGDVTDIVWWRDLGLPVRSVIGRDGRLVGSAPPGMAPAGAAIYEAELAGRTVRQAQRRMVELLGESGELRGEPRAITHPVKFYENGERPLEIVTSRQWFIRTLAQRDVLAARGRELKWHPPFMQARFQNWVEGLTGDWLISRQRFFGIPFPLWYRVGDSGEPDYSAALVPSEDRLPVDPTTDVPDGFSDSQRGVPGGFVADPDVMDTWATSSLTPQIAGGWEDDPDLFGRLFPMDLRPQGHDIIRTWLFSTVVRSQLEHDQLPWRNAVLSGWILDPDRKKMSKSKGNVVTPMALLEEYGSDAVRYWAASGRPGTDTAFDEGQMKVGRKLAIKILNASQFVLGPRGLDLAGAGGPAAGGEAGPAVTPGDAGEAVDRAVLGGLSRLVDEATAAFEAYDYTRALERTESFFWEFCDNYVELVKRRAYGDLGSRRAASARATLTTALSVLLRLFAPFLPFVSEEVWSWWHPASVHRAPWPTAAEFAAGDGGEAGGAGEGGEAGGAGEPGGAGGGPSVYAAASWLLKEIRRAKTGAGRSQRAPVALLTVRDTAERIALLRASEDDLRQAGSVAEIDWVEVGQAGASVEVELGAG